MNVNIALGKNSSDTVTSAVRAFQEIESCIKGIGGELVEDYPPQSKIEIYDNSICITTRAIFTVSSLLEYTARLGLQEGGKV